MAKFVFSAAEDELLIENIQKHNVIFDSAHPKHKDNLFKDEIWKDISENVCRSVDDCKKRWRNIRDTYMKNKKKLGTGSASVTKKHWPLTSRVAFLDKVEFERSTISNVSPCTSAVNKSLDDDVHENYEGEEPLPDEESCHTGSPSPSGTYGEKRIRSNIDKLGVVLSKRSKERDAIFNKIQSQNELILKMEQNQDDVDLFFRSIAKSVKALPKKGISEAKLKILNLVTELEEKYSEPTMSQEKSITSSSQQSMSFVETVKSIPGPQTKLFTPYDLQNHLLRPTQFVQYNHDDDYIFPQ